MRFFRRPRFCPIFTASMRDDAEREKELLSIPAASTNFHFWLSRRGNFFCGRHTIVVAPSQFPAMRTTCECSYYLRSSRVMFAYDCSVTIGQASHTSSFVAHQQTSCTFRS